MLVLLAYAAVSAAFYLACALELRRARTPERLPRDSADHLILHGVALLAALLWIVALPVLVRVALRRGGPRERLARAGARLAARLPHRRTRLAG